MREENVVQKADGKAAPDTEDACAELDALLGDVMGRMGRGEVGAGMGQLFFGLHRLRSRHDLSTWLELVRQARRHELLNLILEDPLSRHAYERPRGHVGDARLIDLIYGADDGALVRAASPLGQKIFRYTHSAPAAVGVRERRDKMARSIDQVAWFRDGAEVLSMACGHLREAACSEAVRSGVVQRYVGIDQDEQALREAARLNPAMPFTPVRASVGALLRGDTHLGRFDLVYSLGLFDHLAQPLARRLAKYLFGLTRPGGRLLVANFLPHLPDAAFMEVFLDWNLVYRTVSRMKDLCGEIDEAEVADTAVYGDETTGNLLYLEVTRRG